MSSLDTRLITTFVLLALAGSPALADHCCGGGGGKGDHGGSAEPAPAPSASALGPHGGALAAEADANFEVVFERGGVTLHRLGAEGDVKGASGEVVVEFPGTKRAPQRAKLQAVRGKECLRAKLDLRKLAEGAAVATFRVTGLPGEATFQVPFTLARLVEFACPMNCEKPHAEAGNCGACGMALVQRTYIYACSMHPKVTEREPGSACWECGGMKLTRVDSPAAGANAGHKGH